MLRLWVAISAIAAAIAAFRSAGGWYWWLVAGLAAGFLALVRFHQSLSEKRRLLQIRLTLIENELKALQGDISAFNDGGSYTDLAHPYTYDLDIFGKGSIYQMLCRTVTLNGASALAASLSSLLLVKEKILERQEIIKELAATPDLLQNFRVAGLSEAEGPGDQARLLQWMEGEEHFINNKVILTLAVLMPAMSVALILYSILIADWYAGLNFLILANWIILGIFQKQIKPAIQQIGNSEQFLSKLQTILSEFTQQQFTGKWLSDTQATAQNSLANIAGFNKLVKLFDSRDNVFIGPVMNSFFLFDIYCLIRLETWRRKYKSTLLTAVDAVTAADVYVSCATYAFNNQDNIYASITESVNEIHALDIRHPLLPATAAVGNSLSLGNAEQFFLLTGANMTGKSTFIRTIGVSNVLTNMGLPVPAGQLTMPLLDLFTSMRITDSVQEDISYFRAELNRIKMIMDRVRNSKHPYLILLDEPLRGTNSADKQQGTRSIVQTLLTFHAIGIVATHDTGLCDMADNYPGKVSNYYFESKVDNNELTFDFKIRPGASVSNNATILMKQMGIIN